MKILVFSEDHCVMCITKVDQKSHAIHLTAGGYPVTAVCKQQSAPEIFENVRNILIGSIIERANKPVKEDTLSL